MNREAAELVMGWHIESRSEAAPGFGTPSKRISVWVGSDGAMRHAESGWDPTHELGQAFQCLDTVAERLPLSSPIPSWSIIRYDPAGQPTYYVAICGPTAGRGDGPTAAEAITACALDVVGWKP